jgi:CheY-like chemotaxis protein/tetratricopeptide (TPR) repeat protein
MSVQELIQQIADPNVTPSERARLRIRLSKDLEESGKYEESCEALRELWPGVGERPVLNGLDVETSAEVLCRVGVLMSCLGDSKQIEGAQEVAKNLISEAISIFESLPEPEKAAAAQSDLAVCYWREGAIDEARVMLEAALGRLCGTKGEVKALALLRSAIIERSAGRLNEALCIHTEAAPLFEKIGSHALKGKFHGELAMTLKRLSEIEHREDYVDRALIEYAASSYHFGQAGHGRYCARIENNLGFLLSTVGRFVEAHKHINRARRIFEGSKDAGSVAQVDDTRARVLLAEGRHAEAERAARAAVRALEKGDGQALLAEALTTHGVALARTGQYARARRALERAAELLATSQQPGIKDRLISCSLSLLRRRDDASAGPAEFRPPQGWKGFSLLRELKRYERVIIERALKDADGVVTRAALLLGFRHHNSLIWRINKRHASLLQARSPVLPRKRGIMRDPNNLQQRPDADESRAVTILHVEDDHYVADVLRETLEAEGWTVETCADGASALKRLAGDARYDLLLFDQDLPGASGLELVRTVRKLPHRRRTPVVMLSAGDCEADAWRAGVDAFLRKPEDINSVAPMISRLLAAPEEF